MKVFGFACIVIIIGLIIFAKLPGTSRTPSDTTAGNDSQTYIDQGRRIDGKGLHFEAISNYDMAIKLNPNNADAYYYRGIAKTQFRAI